MKDLEKIALSNRNRTQNRKKCTVGYIMKQTKNLLVISLEKEGE